MKDFFSHLFFLKVSPLIRTARHKIIHAEDMLPLPAELDPRASALEKRVLRWQGDWKFLGSALWSMRDYLSWSYSLNVLASLVGLLTPYFIHRFISLVTIGVTEQNFVEVMVVGILMGCSGFLTGLIFQHVFVNNLAADDRLCHGAARKEYY